MSRHTSRNVEFLGQRRFSDDAYKLTTLQGVAIDIK